MKMRKWILMGSALTLLIAGVSVIDRPAQLSSECAFCNPSVLAAQTFYEDDLVLALYTHKPIMPGHILVIPKRHAERFENLTSEEMAQMGDVVGKVNAAAQKVFHTTSYLILQKNGAEVGQTVPHVHFHYMPRVRGDSSALKFLYRMFKANLAGPMKRETLHQIVTQMRTAMQPPASNE